MRVSLTTLLDLLGILLVLVPAFLLDWRFGLMVVGVIVLAVSWTLARAEATPAPGDAL